MMRAAPNRRRRREIGTVTAETAVVLPVLLLIAWLVLALIRLGGVQLACQDAARAAARAASRGEPAAVVVDTALRAAPDGARVEVRHAADLLIVEVRARPRLTGPIPLPQPTVTGRAISVAEPGVGRAP
jgi:TadE-like protein